LKQGRDFDCCCGVTMEGVDCVFREENGAVSVIGWVVTRVVDRMAVREKNGPWRALEEVMSDPSLK
jgi:hypothetical protein